MSTKTSIKRIAAVAAVALTLGGFTAVQSHAAAAATASFSVTGANSTTAGIAAVATGTADGQHYLTVTLTQPASSVDSGTSVASSGVGSIYGTATASGSTTVVNSNGTNASAGFLVYGGTGAIGAALLPNNGTITFNVVSATAGTQTITATPINGTSAASTLTITWGAAPALNVGYTAAASFIGDGTTRPSSAGTPTLTYPKANAALSSTTGATIAVNVKDASNADLAGQPISATVTGPGLITLAAGSGAGTTGTVRAASLTAAAMTDSHATIGVSGDGTAGTSTITVSSGTTVLFTKTVTFTGSVASLKLVAQNLFIAPASAAGGTLGSTTTGDDGSTVAKTAAVEFEALDANGNVVTGVNGSLSASIADKTVIASAATAEEAGAASTIGANGSGYYIASVTSAPAGTSGKSTTVTFRYAVGDGTYITLAPLTFTLGGSIAKEVLSSDAASYTALAPIKLTLTATDSSGNPAYDQTVAAGLTSTLVSTTQLGGTAFSATTFTSVVNGVSTAKGFYAPSVAGSFTISGTDSKSTAGEAVSVTAASTGGSSDTAAQAAVDAANEATDAANAATDAANNAMDSADAAQQAALDAGDKADAALAAVTDLASKVSDIASQISSLSALVAKIAASVAKISAKVKA